MIHLLWSLLNLFLVLSFFYFCIGLIVKGRKFLEPYFKPFVVLILFFGCTGLLKSSVSGPNEKTTIIPRLLTRQVFPVVSHLSNKLQLTIFRDPETKEIIQENSKSSLSGLVMGIRWHHLVVTENQDGLEIEGWWDWSLMGNRVFRNYQIYKIEAVDQVSKELLP